jgi:NRAMP (natural resistance-associated macrophage protein)-like metal ion transporter
MNLKKYFGPSTLVAAAFIGPGTLTICTLTGASTGYSLLWALLFSIIATIVLQEMTARLGVVSQKGLGEAIRNEFKTPIARWLSIVLVISAIVIGNGAYEAGNIAGSVLGADLIFGNFAFQNINLTPLLIGTIAFFLLNTGKYKVIEGFLIGLVLIMSVVFIITAIVVQPNLGEIAQGLFIPKVDSDSLLLVIGLIGTTVVPYNLFLHASSIQQKWGKNSPLRDVRIENAVAIILGGLISMCIVITSASATSSGSGEVSNAADMAVQLEPILGSWAKYFMALGLFAAGITSAITAPLAAAMAANGLLGWNADFKDIRFKSVWMIILAVGTILAMLGFKPIAIIQFAQVANGVLLPIIAGFLLYIMNKKAILEDHTNSLVQNILGFIVIAVTIFISLRSLNSVFGFL